MPAFLDKFTDELNTYLTGMKQAVKRGAHHDERRHLFLLLLHDTFHIEADEVEVEKGIRVAKIRGYIDALYQDLVFEFKRNLGKEREVGRARRAGYVFNVARREVVRCAHRWTNLRDICSEGRKTSNPRKAD